MKEPNTPLEESPKTSQRCKYCRGRSYQLVERGSSLKYTCPDCAGEGVIHDPGSCPDCGCEELEIGKYEGAYHCPDCGCEVCT